MVYSSDMTSTSCYSMAPIVTPTSISMTKLTTIASVLPIYGAGSITFADDTAAYTTVDINLSKVTSISSWCP
jgi:hypothetical protein